MDELKQYKIVTRSLAIGQVLCALATIFEGVRSLVIWSYHPMLTGLLALAGSYACFKWSIKYKKSLAQSLQDVAEARIYDQLPRRERRKLQRKLKKMRNK